LQPAGSAVVDPAGRDAENIFAGRKGRMPVFQSPHGARLLIGDQAIRFRQKYAEEFHFWDLGEEWNRLVGLPFVYALWLIRPEVKDPNTIANRLRALRDDNLEHLAELVVTEKEFDSEFCRRYYCDHLRFKFGSSERKGLQSFASLCAKHGLLEKDKLQFTLV
jgi:predicted solute-binding protein